MKKEEEEERNRADFDSGGVRTRRLQTLFVLEFTRMILN